MEHVIWKSVIVVPFVWSVVHVPFAGGELIVNWTAPTPVATPFVVVTVYEASNFQYWIVGLLENNWLIAVKFCVSRPEKKKVGN